MKCEQAPEGWACSREANHEGPCAAWPNTFWQKLKWSWLFRWDLSSMYAIWRGRN